MLRLEVWSQLIGFLEVDVGIVHTIGADRLLDPGGWVEEWFDYYSKKLP